MKELLSQKQQEALLHEVALVERQLKKRSGVRDVVLGFRFKDGKRTDEIGIIVYMYDKNDQDVEFFLEKRNLFSTDLPIDIEISDPVEHSHDPYSRVNDLLGGLSIANTRFRNSGTLGAIVYDIDTEEPMGLSNHHVLVKRGSVFRRAGQKGDRINQPAFKPDVVEFNCGKLKRWSRKLDAAIFSVSDRMVDDFDSLNGIKGKILGATYPLLGTEVKKSGARSLVTSGEIIAISSDGIRLTIGPSKSNPAPNNEISMAGDSGALWVNDNNEAIALHWGGDKPNTPNSERAYAVNILPILETLNVKF